jgi:hypothetical protein
VYEALAARGARRPIYAKTKLPTSRLVTCAGPVNSSGCHSDNYIVFATLVQ